MTRLAQCLRAGTTLDLQGAVIPADLLRAALIGHPYRDGSEPLIAVADIDPRGLQIINADIRGHLDLRSATISPTVTITDSTIFDGIDLRDSHLNHGLYLDHSVISSLNLTDAGIAGNLLMSGTQLTGTNQDGNSLVANGLQVDGDALLDEGFTAAGAVRLHDARITGQLGMNGAQLTGNDQNGNSLIADRLQAESAFLEDGFTTAGAVRLPGARITGQLAMSGAQLTGNDQNGNSLIADRLQVDGDTFLDDGFTTAGAVRLPGARITGQLAMSGAQLAGTMDGDSLIASRLQVDGDMLLDDGFTTAGAVRLPGARITGQLSMRGAQFAGAEQNGNSLIADRLQVDGGAFLDSGFTAAGAVRLLSARITSQLAMRGARLTGTDQDGDSLIADRLQVDGDTFLDDGFTTAGAVRLPGARITGQLSMRGAQLAGADQDGNSLIAGGLQVDGSALLDSRFTTVGAVRLAGARITGQFNISVKSIRASTADSPGLDLTGATVDDPYIDLRRVDWINRPRARPHPGSLPSPQVMLSLENCTYKHRPDPDLGGVETWLRMLRFHTPDYQPRSYQQLAAVHRASGHDRDAARILMAQQDHRRAVALRPRPGARFRHRVGLCMSRAGLGFWKATLGYGYRPRRALAWLLALLATAGLLVAVAAHWQADPGKPDVPVAYRPGNSAAGIPPEYCSFGEAAGLAVRIAIPLVTNLGQGTCIVNTATIPGSVIVTASIALQTFAWILGGLTIAAAATAIKRSP